MKITAIEPLVCDGGFDVRNWIFVKVTTDEGVVGWGEGYDTHSAPVLAEAIRRIGREWIGQDPLRIETFNQRIWSSARSGLPELLKVLAALDIAFHDIKAKWLGVPVYELLGGWYRDRIPLYWSHFASYRAFWPEALGVPPAETLESWLALTDDVVAAGYRALKTNLLIPCHPVGLSSELDGAIDHRALDAAVAFVGGLRDKLGPSFGILFDVGHVYRMAGLVPLARALEPFNLYWLEAEGYDPDALAAVRSQTSTRLCHGESLIRREAFLPFLRRQVSDVVMIETLANGLSESRRIAELASLYDVMISPHNFMSPFTTLVNAHLCAAMPNTEILEIDPDDLPWKMDLLTEPLEVESGELLVPDRPGFGADIVEEVVRAHPLRA